MGNTNNQTLKEKRAVIIKLWNEWLLATFDKLNHQHRLKAACVVARSLVSRLEHLYDNSHLEIAHDYFISIRTELTSLEPDAGQVFIYARELRTFLEASIEITDAALWDNYPNQMKRSPNEVYLMLDDAAPRSF